MDTTQTILVTGATGTVGRRIADELVRRGHRVRALTRDPASAAAARLPDAVDAVRGDLTDPAGLAPALAGVDALHLITFGGEMFAPLQTGPEIVGLARAAGVRRITVLHGGGPSPLETAVRDSALDWTVVMPVEFMANALEWAEPIRTADTVEEPFTGRLSAMVHEADIGAVTAVALTEDGHAGREYLITGPQSLTLQDKVDALAAARGRAIRLVELSEEEARKRWAAAGQPQEVIDFLIQVYRDTPPEGKNVTDVVEKVTGRPARTFTDWAREHAAAFRV
ncbi:SDR family NAD(P)-dependent oxidoreductase [Streptomyces sp. PR69]|uniref:SDR family NAD(P)-dependent oxidoreductase n=1 Tax=Streptomyces sp. PR69 TaxID=2984950 RepID=UPI00226509FF|nr:SDR family NAD(P)-dependent oxidoreductase [Streptomyces sp. PR69]